MTPLPDLGNLPTPEEKAEAEKAERLAEANSPSEKPLVLYANDAKLRMDPSGNVQLEFIYRVGGGEYGKPVVVSMPFGVYDAICSAAESVGDQYAQILGATVQQFLPGIEEAIGRADGSE